MRALTYHGTRDVRVETVPDPVVQDSDDIILRVTATAICGSDLHLYRGKMPGMEDGDILGHEFMGVVEDAGPDVVRIARGDRVVVPFVIACGTCFFCQRGLPQKCLQGVKYGHEPLRPGRELLGGLAEHCLLAPGTAIVRLPDSLSLAVACPANCATATAERSS